MQSEKSFYSRSFGCKVNQYDGQSLRERLLRQAFRETDTPEEADLIALHFCVVTARSAARCLRALKGLSGRRPHARFLIAGCLGPEEREKILKIRPDAVLAGLDGAVDPGASSQNERPGGLPLSTRGFGPISGHAGHTRAFLKVQDGCNLRCSYCIIPSMRGSESSRPPREILREADRLLAAGYREIVLCGIRLGGYRWKERRLDWLLGLLLKTLKGPCRLRLSSMNPSEVTAPLLEVMGSDARVAPHFHLPLQSGDPEILRRMRRPYRPESFLEKARAIRRLLPDPALTTDLLVGFPGEGEEAFERSLKVLEEARIARVHVFPFSARPGTEAAGYLPVQEPIKAERTKRALEAATILKERFDRSCLGMEETLLIESKGRNGASSNRPSGLTSRYQKVELLDDPPRPGSGDFIPLVLESYTGGIFQGRAR